MTKAKDLQSEISKILDKNVILGKNGAIIKHELIFQAILALIKKHEKGVIDPAIQESMKASTAKFTAEELITKREAVREEVKTLLVEKLRPHGIIIDEFNIIDFDFSSSFNAAIEDKVTAEQEALAAENRLEKVKFEAQQRIEEAKGKAEAINIEARAISTNPQIIELRAIEKWNGTLPQVTGGAVPFINIK